MKHKNSYRIDKNFLGRVPFVYFIRHTPSGLWYIGAKYSANANPEYFMVKYFTSSDMMHELMENALRSDFYTKILKVCTTTEETLSHENRILTRLNAVANPMSANRDNRQSPEGAIQNKYSTIMVSNKTTGKCIRIKKGSPIPDGWVKGNINKGGSKSAGRSWYYDPETLQTFHLLKGQEPETSWVAGRGPGYVSNSENMKSKKIKCITNGMENKIISIEDNIPDGWVRGRTKSDIERKNSNESNSKRKGTRYYTNGNDVRQISDASEVPEGWYIGNPKIKSVLGKIKINNGVRNAYINPGDTIPEGFVLGGKPQKRK